MESKLYTVQETIQLIKSGKLLSLAADEEILSQLPAGNWIAGTSPYFMDTEKGIFSKTHIFVNELSTFGNEYSIKVYDENNIYDITKNSYANGYTLIIIPPFKEIHKKYALEADNLVGLYKNPIIGWVSGNDLSENVQPKTFNGNKLEVYSDKAVAIHVKLPDDKFAEIQIVNIFERDENSDEIQFLNDGFECEYCIINGEKTLLSAYLKKNNIDVKSPLIADYSGAMINVSIKNVEDEKVRFYAPVFNDRIYKFAKKIDNYIYEFEKNIPKLEVQSEFSCNCILNYLYGDLENKKIKSTTGPITFGEIAYKLLNQTLIHLIISDK
ncbi:MAG: hypothetical protein L3J74_09100 [Bacteroidales bacterium]|nr:hypothetical protein [Bacteroidales bacterium]